MSLQKAQYPIETWVVRRHFRSKNSWSRNRQVAVSQLRLPEVDLPAFASAFATI